MRARAGSAAAFHGWVCGGVREHLGCVGKEREAFMTAEQESLNTVRRRVPRLRACASWLSARPMRTLAIALAIVLAIALVPMFAISAYDHSYADDWHYGVDAHLALEAGEGVLGAVAAALTEAVDTYDGWQGTYSAIVLMALQPGVFSEELYGLGAVAIIAALVLSTGYVTSVVLRDVLGTGRAPWLALTCLILLLQMQLLPSPVEGIWWYNSAVYYTFYHALMLLGCGLSVRLLHGRTRRGALSVQGSCVRAVALALLAFVVAGGNFVTGLVSVIALTGAVMVGIVRGRRAAWLLVPALLVLVGGFACSMAAPGNAVRQATQFPGDNLGVLMTLVRSGLAGFEYALLWTNGFMVLSLVIALPVFVAIARRTTCSFALPGVVALVSLTLFMASFAPTFYSMGTVGPGRVQNIRYDLFVLLVYVCVGWTCGWAVRKMERRASRDVWHRLCRAVPAHACICMTVLVLMVVSLAVDERHRDDLTSMSAAASIISGEAQEYDEQVWERIAKLEQSDDASVDVPFYTVGPKVLFMGDIKDNMNNYINFRLAQWYGKESVIGYYSVLS